MRYEELNAYIDSLGLKYSALFIPQSKSRNAGNKNPSLNWIVSINSLSTDYMQGIAHTPKYSQAQDNDGWKNKYYAEVAETGKYHTIKPKFSNGKIDYCSMHEERAFVGCRALNLPDPLLRDVLYSLVMDSSAMDYESFEQWAGDFGYDTDSIKANKIYQDCLKISLKLRSIIGSEALEKLQTLFQDY